MGKFLISGVWKNSNDVITHVNMNEITEERNDGSYSFSTGSKVTLKDAIEKCRKHYIYTLIWQYPGWRKGAEVIIVGSGINEYLRTKPDSTLIDNLDNVINMKAFG